MKKPSWFSVYDLLTLGLGGIASIGLFVYALVTANGNEHRIQALALLASVGVCFMAIYGFYLLERWNWIRQFTWIPEYFMMVKFGKYTGSTAVDILRLTKETVERWKPYHPDAEALLKSDVNWVFFERDLDELPPTHIGLTKKVKGFALVGTHTIAVDFNGDELATTTAFEHELGHIIHGLATKQWDQEEHHKFAVEHGLK